MGSYLPCSHGPRPPFPMYPIFLAIGYPLLLRSMGRGCLVPPFFFIDHWREVLFECLFILHVSPLGKNGGFYYHCDCLNMFDLPWFPINLWCSRKHSNGKRLIKIIVTITLVKYLDVEIIFWFLILWGFSWGWWSGFWVNIWKGVEIYIIVGYMHIFCIFPPTLYNSGMVWDQHIL